jgi:hypothetical protein
MASAVEHLRVAHRLALGALHDSEADAAGLVRAWPRLAQAAHTVARALPDDTGDEDRVLQRIGLDALSLAEVTSELRWPGNVPPDPALMRVAAVFEGVAAMAGTGSMLAGDVAEARRLILGSLWTTARLVGRATRDHSYDVGLDHQHLEGVRSRTARAAMDLYRRFNAVEQLACLALRDTAPGKSENGPTSRLRQAIAIWDVEAHRALLTNRSTAALHVLAHQQAASVEAFRLFVDRATAGGVIDPLTHQRLMPVLADSSSSWGRLRDTAAEFCFGSTPLPESLLDAATDLRERFQDAVRPPGLGDRRETLAALSGHLASAVTICAATRDLIAAGELRAPARAIARAVREQWPNLVEAVVDPRDIQRGASVPLPDQARSLLAEPAARAFIAADEAVNRGAGLDALYRSPAGADPATRPTDPGRRPADNPSPARPRDPAGGRSI